MSWTSNRLSNLGLPVWVQAWNSSGAMSNLFSVAACPKAGRCRVFLVAIRDGALDALPDLCFNLLTTNLVGPTERCTSVRKVGASLFTLTGNGRVLHCVSLFASFYCEVNFMKYTTHKTKVQPMVKCPMKFNAWIMSPYLLLTVVWLVVGGGFCPISL